MPRASGNDLCEIFGYAPDDNSDIARKQWKSQRCPFVNSPCTKIGHSQTRETLVYGSCSIKNVSRARVEEIVICPKRLYAENYGALRNCISDALESMPDLFLFDEYQARKRQHDLPNEFVVMMGQHSGNEISLTRPGVIKLSVDWVFAHVLEGKLDLIIPCEVQSIDITGNYRNNWIAYSQEKTEIPNSIHGMNWANVWKRLIPQIMLKGSIASTSRLCNRGLYFVVPDRVYKQFEKIVGDVPLVEDPRTNVMTVMTYELGPEVAFGHIRELRCTRKIRMEISNFAKAFVSGKQLPLGTQLDCKVMQMLGIQA